MATLRHGIPNGTSGDCRIALRLNEDFYQILQKFGLRFAYDNKYPHLTKELNKEIHDWIKTNCVGRVYHIRYNLCKNADQFIWEFFFKTPGDAILFKLRFG